MHKYGSWFFCIGIGGWKRKILNRMREGKKDKEENGHNSIDSGYYQGPSALLCP